jgi:hypothetical protein
MRKQINFEEITLRLQISSRGGGIEIDLSTLGFKGERMSAYQNYLGGGMLGCINSDSTIQAFGKMVTEKQQSKLDNIEEQLKKYFHELTNPEEDEWESVSYELNQLLSSSSY